MALWILKRHEAEGHDEMFACIVRAPTEAKARKIAGRHCGDEGKRPWLSPGPRMGSSCERVDRKGKAAMILRDFQPG